MPISSDLSTEEILNRFLGKARAVSLRKFQKEDEISDENVRTIAQMGGRGYRPPDTVERWREYYALFKRIGIFDGEEDD
jgi:hypothetical protein